MSEAFGQWGNAKIVILALLGLTAGQAVFWYTGQFYVLFFMQSILKVDNFTANVLVAWSLIIGTWGFRSSARCPTGPVTSTTASGTRSWWH
jgi:hypothetical protein